MKPSVMLPLGFMPELTGDGEALLQTLMDCHAAAARQNANVSSEVAKVVVRSSGSLMHSVCAAMLTVGGIHAPVRQARIVFRDATDELIAEAMRDGKKIPGFGNSFFREGVDPSFLPLAAQIGAGWPPALRRIQSLQDAIAAAGKKLYPNAALLTAAVCEILDVPDGVEDALFVISRLPVWVELAGLQPRGDLWA